MYILCYARNTYDYKYGLFVYIYLISISTDGTQLVFTDGTQLVCHADSDK